MIQIMKLLIGIVVILIFGCNKAPSHSTKTFHLKEPSIIIVQMDSIEIDSLKTKYGKEEFYTGADDLMWYNSMLIEKCDSLKTPIITIDSDSISLEYNGEHVLLTKDSTFGIYTYFSFNGKKVERKDLFELINL